MRFWACCLSISAYIVGSLVLSLLLACRISSNWGEFKSTNIDREGFLSPWTTCQRLPDGKQVHCVKAESLSDKLNLAGQLGDTTIVLQICFLLAALVEIVLLMQHKEHSWEYRASTVSKVTFAAAATITSLLAVYLYLTGIEALVAYTHKHSPPYYAWWLMIVLSMSSFVLSCVHVRVVYRNHQ